MKIEWEICDFRDTCCSWPYGCDRCWKGKVHHQKGIIRLNFAIAGYPITIMVTVLHEMLHLLFFRLKIPFLHKLLDSVDGGEEG